MAYKLIITKSAQAELEKIADYISESLCNPVAALDFLKQVEKCYNTLSDNPLIYQVCDSIGTKYKEYRKVVINNYILIYRVDTDTNIVYILHFFYGRRDYFNLI